MTWNGLFPMFYFEVQTPFLVQYDMCVKDVRINCWAPSRKNLIDVRVCETGLAGSIQSRVCLHSLPEEFYRVSRNARLFPVSTWNSFSVTAQRLKEPRLERKKKNWLGWKKEKVICGSDNALLRKERENACVASAFAGLGHFAMTPLVCLARRACCCILVSSLLSLPREDYLHRGWTGWTRNGCICAKLF